MNNNTNNSGLNNNGTGYFDQSVNENYDLLVPSYSNDGDGEYLGERTLRLTTKSPSILKNKHYFSPSQESSLLYGFNIQGQVKPIEFLPQLIGDSLFRSGGTGLSNYLVAIVNGQQVYSSNIVKDYSQSQYNYSFYGFWRFLPIIKNKIFLSNGNVVIRAYSNGNFINPNKRVEIIATVSRSTEDGIPVISVKQYVNSIASNQPIIIETNENEDKRFELRRAAYVNTFSISNISDESNPQNIPYASYERVGQIISNCKIIGNIAFYIGSSYQTGVRSLYATNINTGNTKLLFNSDINSNLNQDMAGLSTVTYQIARLNNKLYIGPYSGTRGLSSDYIYNLKYKFFVVDVSDINDDLTNTLDNEDVNSFVIYDGATENKIRNVTPSNNNWHFLKNNDNIVAIHPSHMSIDEANGDIYILADCNPNISRAFAYRNIGGTSYRYYSDNHRITFRILSKFDSDFNKQFETLYYGAKEYNTDQCFIMDENYIYMVLQELRILGSENSSYNLFGNTTDTIATTQLSNTSISNSLYLTDNRLCRISKANGNVLSAFNIHSTLKAWPGYIEPFHNPVFHDINNDGVVDSLVTSVGKYGGSRNTWRVWIADLQEANPEDESSSSSSESSRSGTSSSSSSQSESESSHSSSSSRSSDSSSSSSSYEVLPDNHTYAGFISQGNHNLLAFSFSVISANNPDNMSLGFDWGTTATFKFNPDTSTQNENHNNYNNVKSIELLASNTNWISGYSASIFANNTTFSQPENYYFTPKFEWSTNAIVENYSSSSDNSDGSANSDNDTRYVLIGSTSTNQLRTFEIGTGVVSYKLFDTDSPVASLTYGAGRSDVYFSTNGKLNKNRVEYFLTNSSPINESYEIISKPNINQDSVLFDDNTYLWTSQIYKGKLIRRNKDDLEIDHVFEPIDSIKKIIYFDRKAILYAVGNKNIWKITNDTMNAVTGFGSISIKDAEISSNGHIVVLTNDNKMKVLKPDFFGIRFSSTISGQIYKTVKYNDGVIVIDSITKSQNYFEVKIQYFDGKTTTTKTYKCDKEKQVSYPETVKFLDATSYEDYLLISLANGVLLEIDMVSSSGIAFKNEHDITNMFAASSVRETKINSTKIRVFVGSSLNSCDKWDSGEILSTDNYVYYGGGNNLVPGETYYVSIQIYSEKYGWSSISTQEFTVPI